jgi:hypothetical protein
MKQHQTICALYQLVGKIDPRFPKSLSLRRFLRLQLGRQRNMLQLKESIVSQTKIEDLLKLLFILNKV